MSNETKKHTHRPKFTDNYNNNNNCIIITIDAFCINKQNNAKLKKNSNCSTKSSNRNL